MMAGLRSAAGYAGLLCAAMLAGVMAGWFLGAEADNYAYDFMLRHYPPSHWQPHSTILAIDEATLVATPGGIQGIRKPLADALELIAAARPKTVIVDLTLADRGQDPTVDAHLAAAFRATPNLVLTSELLDNGWEDPLPEFSSAAAALGHVHAQPDRNDEITRVIPLEEHFGRTKRWALSLEAYRLFTGSQITITPAELRVGDSSVPIPDRHDGRLMRVHFAPPEIDPIPRVSMEALLKTPALASQFTGRAVFIGVTAITVVKDRLMTPVGRRQTSGIEIHADAFETMAQKLFLTDISSSYVWALLFSAALAAAAGLAFWFFPGWLAYVGGAAVIAAAFLTPYVFFIHGRVFSLKAPAAAAWLSVIAAAAYQHVATRRNWRKEHAARTRYQQAMHFVTHEMRTPLSAIQGSSELISRFPLTEDKRKQIALLINSESKRLARMVEIFLNVERLSAGQMELKREVIPVREMVELCVERVRPVADRKRIEIRLERVPDDLRLSGDRELMEYACYNLLTNAVKYSPQRTQVTASAWKEAGQIRIAVKDQGIGMEQKELKQIFRKFYRTKKAEESGEAGTGIGLSIVQQIVERHGGEITVASQPGAGSCFTLALPAGAALPSLAERS